MHIQPLILQLTLYRNDTHGKDILLVKWCDTVGNVSSFVNHSIGLLCQVLLPILTGFSTSKWCRMGNCGVVIAVHNIKHHVNGFIANKLTVLITHILHSTIRTAYLTKFQVRIHVVVHVSLKNP